MYELYTDKLTNFECKIELEGASVNDAFARIILNTENVKYMFDGSIDGSGICKIPIRKMKGLLEVNSGGEMILEVIADDTYFRAWDSKFVISSSKKIQVEVVDNSEEVKKPKMRVMVKQEGKQDNIKILASAIIKRLQNEKISVKNILKHKNLLRKYIPEDLSHKDKHKLIEQIVKKLK